MKKFLGIMLVLCVVAPATFGVTYLDEYTWQGTTGNFTDAASWKVTNTNDPAGAASRPAVPYESANTTDYTNYARPAITNTGSAVLVNSNVGPLGVGFTQVQLDKGSLTIDAGGKLVVGQGYMTCGAKNTAAGGGLIVQNGGQYVNLSNNVAGNQNGTLLNYTTANSMGSVTVSGASTLFDSQIVYIGRPGQTQVRTGLVNVLGSGSTINVGTYGPGGNNTTAIFNFTTDAGGLSKINIATKLAFNQGVTATHTANVAKLNLILGQAPAVVGETITLFDLAAGATRTGYLARMDGTVLTPEMNVFAKFADNWYTYKVSYMGGETGNDVTLTYIVPEPATMAILGLGGLFLARRRRVA